MFSIKFNHGHFQVYDAKGSFLFSADSVSEARRELKEYEKSAD